MFRLCDEARSVDLRNLVVRLTYDMQSRQLTYIIYVDLHVLTSWPRLDKVI